MMARRAIPIPPKSAVSLNDPIRLSVASALAFPDGTMTVSGLRRERDRGRLAVEMIAGREYTTLAAIEEMRKKCREDQKAPDCGLSQPSATQADASSETHPGLSATALPNIALDAARQRLQKLKQNSPTKK